MHESGDAPDELVTGWQKIRQGNKEDFADFYRLSASRLYAYGIKLVDDKELVKDSIHDLFIHLFQNRSSLPDADNPVFYLFNSLRNLLIDALRKSDRLVYISPEELPFHVCISWDQESDGETDESVREKFNTVIRLLSERQKEAIYLRFKTGMSYDDIARLMGINYQSVRNLIHRSIEKIRSHL
jgi:RNA polymerase sigma-70 factor (ECF subfamily)